MQTQAQQLLQHAEANMKQGKDVVIRHIPQNALVDYLQNTSNCKRTMSASYGVGWVEVKLQFSRG